MGGNLALCRATEAESGMFSPVDLVEFELTAEELSDLESGKRPFYGSAPHNVPIATPPAAVERTGSPELQPLIAGLRQDLALAVNCKDEKDTIRHLELAIATIDLVLPWPGVDWIALRSDLGLALEWLANSERERGINKIRQARRRAGI